jgi:hypothetical protein
MFYAKFPILSTEIITTRQQKLRASDTSFIFIAFALQLAPSAGEQLNLQDVPDGPNISGPARSVRKQTHESLL